MSKTTNTVLFLLATAFVVTDAAAVHAGENGGSSDTTGSEGFLTGALPPPGVYWLDYISYYTADRLNDGKGNKSPTTADVDAIVNSFLGVYVTDVKVFGGDLAFSGTLNVASINVGVGGVSDSTVGIGDFYLRAPAIGWHWDGFHLVAAFETVIPIGAYERDALANFGRNYFTFSPIVAVTAMPWEGLELSAKTRLNFNTTNTSATFSPTNPQGADYHSGTEFAVDFAAGYNLTPQWEIGVQGYYLKQIEDDEIKGDRAADKALQDVLDGNRGEVFAIGPAVRFASKGGTNIYVLWEHEFYAENRTQGDSFWFKLVTKLF